ncbi:MAG: CaiB/BaiF CoA transferase family protein [Kiloniellaceae bacterium]
MHARCLEGFRVLDLSQYLPGPYGAQILADLGAEVVKIEPPAGDPMRAISPREADGVSAFYKLINAGKTVVRLDLKSAADRAAFETLVRRADALVESFRPGALARLGLGAQTLQALNPRLVHCALSGFGQTGPYARRAGHDINYMAHAGGLAESGTPERPVVAYPPTADFAGGMQAALTVLAALLRRERGGRGAVIDVSLAETVLAWQGIALTAALHAGGGPARAASLLNGGAACYQVYETADGRFVTLGALEDKFWANFCRSVGRVDWIARQGEPLPQSALIAEVAALIRGRTLAAWAHHLKDVDCCFQPVLEPHEVPDDAQVRARGLVRRAEGPDPRFEVLFPAFFDGRPPRPRPPVRELPADEVLDAWGCG